MKIEDDTSQPQNKTQELDQKKCLFEDIRKLEEFKRRPHQWITNEYFKILSEIFIKYPQYHSIIIKACKISQSTYHRLLKEHSTNSFTYRTEKRNERSLRRLTEIEKASVKLMLIPPTKPITLNCI